MYLYYYINMKNLKNILLEKLDISKVNLVPNKFPINGTLKEIEKFLEANDFENFDDYDLDMQYFSEYADFVNTEGKKLFLISTTGKFVRFIDTSQKDLGEDNPMFCIKTNVDGLFAVEIDEFYQKCLDKKDFLKALNKRFGWK